MTVVAHRPIDSTPTAGHPRPVVLDVAIVAAGPVVRSGLATVINGVRGLRAGQQVESITQLAEAAAGKPVVIELGGRPGVVHDASFWSLAPRRSRIIALCLPENPPDLITALRAGVHALITRESETEELITAIRVAARGGLHIAPDLFGPVVQTSAPRARNRALTQREIEALTLIASGLTHGQVSRRMGLTEATVSTYVKRIRHKLNAGNKAELTRQAIEMGYLSPR